VYRQTPAAACRPFCKSGVAAGWRPHHWQDTRRVEAVGGSAMRGKQARPAWRRDTADQRGASSGAATGTALPTTAARAYAPRHRRAAGPVPSMRRPVSDHRAAHTRDSHTDGRSAHWLTQGALSARALTRPTRAQPAFAPAGCASTPGMRSATTLHLRKLYALAILTDESSKILGITSPQLCGAGV
jgi:hypothetical protein